MGELIVLVLLLAILVCAIVLPIIATFVAIRSRRKLSQLEARLSRIESGFTSPPPKAPPEPVPAQTPPPPKPETEPPPITPPPTAPQPPAPTRTIKADELESIIGRRWVGWIAIGLILFATAFFLKYAFDNRWIGELGRVAFGVVAGIGMSAAGYIYHRKQWRIFSQILTAGGIVLLYLSNYAAFGYYHLVGQKTAFAFLVLLIAEAAGLALLYNAPAIAIMALLGGFLNPLLLHSDRDQYQSLFAYLVVLDIGALALLKHWRGLSSVAYFGTQILFWIWYNESYHHQKRAAVLIFQTVVFLIFLLAHVGRDLIRRESSSLEDALLLLINPFVFFATTYHLLNPTHHDWMGVLAIGLALLYAGAAKVLLQRSPKSRREILLLIAVALTFVTVAIPIQLRSNWITIAWAVEGLAILWAALEIRSVRLRAHALGLFVLAFFKLLLWDTPHGLRPRFIPVFNRYFLSSLAVVLCFIAAIYLYEKVREKKLVEAKVTKLVLGLAAVVAFWWVLSIETETFFTARVFAERELEDAAHQRWLGQMALSVVWATYAGALAALGFVRRAPAIRWASLVLFAITILKAMVIDIARLEQLYRIIVFFVLGLLLLLLAWAYHRAFHSQESSK